MPTLHSHLLGLTDTGDFRRNSIALIDEALECSLGICSLRSQSSFLPLYAPTMERSLKYERDTEAGYRPYLEVQRELQETAKQMTIIRFFSLNSCVSLAPSCCNHRMWRSRTDCTTTYNYYNIVKYGPVARQWACKHISATHYSTQHTTSSRSASCCVSLYFLHCPSEHNTYQHLIYITCVNGFIRGNNFTTCFGSQNHHQVRNIDNNFSNY
jgi:hypothetical protein